MFLLVFLCNLCHISFNYHYLEDDMGYKKMKKNLGFADFALSSSLKHNRSLKLMDKISHSIDWDRINAVRPLHNPQKNIL